MGYVSFGDLALTYQSRRQNVQIKSDIARLSQELASGEKSDISTKFTGDFAPLISIERDLSKNLAYAISNNEANILVSTQQSALQVIQSTVSNLGVALLNAGNSASSALIETTAADAKVKFSSIVSALNTQVVGRYIFSGAATNTPALADAETILNTLEAAIAAQTTAAGIVSVVDAWFNDIGGGFDTTAYTGSTNAMAPVRLSDSETAQIDTMANDTEIRSVLQSFALAALIDRGALGSDITERSNLAKIAGEQVVNSDTTLALIRAKVGSTEAQVDGASARNNAQKSALEIVRTDLVSIDPYRVATELEATKTQLETVFALTVRLSRLSLSEFMR